MLEIQHKFLKNHFNESIYAWALSESNNFHLLEGGLLQIVIGCIFRM